MILVVVIMMKIKITNIVNLSFTVFGKSIVLKPACLRLLVLLHYPSFSFVSLFFLPVFSDE